MAPWLLITVGALVYANSLEGPFIFDDLGAIVGNPDIRHLWPLWQDPDSTPRPSLNGRPVVKLSLALNYAIGGLDVRWYHAVNIALHIGCALVLCSIVRRTLLGAYLPPAPHTQQASKTTIPAAPTRETLLAQTATTHPLVSGTAHRREEQTVPKGHAATQI